MSEISEKIRAALFGKLNVSDVTTLATKGVHYWQAPSGTVAPFVVFQRQAPGNVLYALGNNQVGEDDLWLIKALTDSDSSETLGPTALGEQILAACMTAIGDSLTVAGNLVRMVRRVNDMPPYKEDLNDRVIFHNGFLLRIFTE